MAETFNTVAHILQQSDLNLSDAEVSDILNDAPLIRALAAETASHATSHKYTKETTAPTNGFRQPNAGRANTGSQDTLVTLNLAILDATFDCDSAVANANPASKGGRAGYIQREARRSLRAALFGAESQIWYGTGLDSDGFVGLNANAPVQYNDSAMVVDATGTTVGGASSVWLIRTNDMGTDVEFIVGQDGQIDIGETTSIQKLDGSSNPYVAYMTQMQMWAGLQVGSIYSVGRIVNLTAEAGKGLTDDLIFSLLEKFPASRRPNLCVMNQQSQEQLRSSRTATNATGAPAPLPESVANIPILTTDSLLKTEALVGATP